jgi:hypothetical protein
MLKPLLHHPACNLLVLAALALCAPAAQAQDQPCGAVGDAERFAAFHDNYALVNQMSNNGWASRDERAVRGQLSVKYSFVGCPQRREKDSHTLKPAPADTEAKTEGDKDPGKPTSFWQRMRNAELFVSYTNRFDFYLGSRDSGPVINRLSNPGVHLRLPVRLSSDDKEDGRRDAWQISLEHMSDGQVVDPVNNAHDQLLAQQAYERGDHRFFDTLSRGMNYVAVQGEWVWQLPAKKDAQFDVRAKVKAYVGKPESAITWGPLAGQGLKFADYERAKIRLGLYWPHLGRFELTTQIGDRGFSHASHSLGWQYTVRCPFLNLELPIYVLAHYGPMNTLSNYTQRQDSIGFGVRLAY